MTSSIVEEDIDLDSLIDFDASVACVMRLDVEYVPNCDIPAEWLVYFNCGCNKAPLCTKHKDEYIRIVNHRLNTVGGHCPICKRTVRNIQAIPI